LNGKGAQFVKVWIFDILKRENKATNNEGHLESVLINFVVSHLPFHGVELESLFVHSLQ